MLGRGRLEHPFEIRLEIWFVFLGGFSWILGRFREGLGGLFGDLRRFWGSRACPGGVCATCFQQGGPQRVPESDFRGLGVYFGRVGA